MKIEIRKVTELTPAAYNPRKDLTPDDAEYQKIKRSIEAFGYVDLVIVNDRTGNVVGGHQRLKVLKDLGYEEIEVSVVDLSDDQEKALNIALNKIGGEWDSVLLKDLLAELDNGDFDVELTGFDMAEIEGLMTQFHIEEDMVEDEFDVSEALEGIQEPTTKRGDIWQLGRHRLMCGDSTSESDIAELMDGEQSNLLFTDPPYGYSYQSNMRGKSEKFDVLKNDDVFLDFLPVVNKFNTGFVFVFTTWKVLGFWIEYFEKHLQLSNMIVWDKGGGGIGDLKRTFSTDYEIALVSHNGNALTGKRIGSVWDIKKDNPNDYVHATQKPVELAATAITHTTNENDIVLDVFGGSGSTLMACEQTNRVNYSMELDEKYCDVIIKRWENFTGNDAVLISR